jgi:hypothetical protein
MDVSSNASGVIAHEHTPVIPQYVGVAPCDRASVFLLLGLLITRDLCLADAVGFLKA